MQCQKNYKTSSTIIRYKHQSLQKVHFSVRYVGSIVSASCACFYANLSDPVFEINVDVAVSHCPRHTMK